MLLLHAIPKFLLSKKLCIRTVCRSRTFVSSATIIRIVAMTLKTSPKAENSSWNPNSTAYIRGCGVGDGYYVIPMTCYVIPNSLIFLWHIFWKSTFFRGLRTPSTSEKYFGLPLSLPHCWKFRCQKNLPEKYKFLFIRNICTHLLIF